MYCLISFLLPCSVYALATVESRTGNPVVRGGQEQHEKEVVSIRHNRRSQSQDAYEFQDLNENNVPHARQSSDSRNVRPNQLTITQIEVLQQEISELRGIIEVQEHEIKQLRKSQTDLFTNLEKRINDLQASAGSGSSVASRVEKNLDKNLDKNIFENSKTKSNLQSEEKSKIAASKSITASKSNANENSKLSDNSKPIENAKIEENTKLNENESFQKGYNYVRSKHYEEAITTFQEHLKRFPRGEQAPSARYWLAEVYFVQWQNDKANTTLLEKAREEFTNLEAEFPSHTKASDALLKLGLIEIEADNMIAAKQYLSDVKTRFPGTAAARIAETKLQQVKD